MRQLQNIEIELNPSEQRLYDRLRAKVVTTARDGGRSSFRDVVLLLPDLTVLLLRLLRDERIPMGNKAIALLGVGYALSPIDLLPTFLFGPFGLVDDLFVVSAALSRVVNHVHPDVVRSHWSGQGDALEAIREVSAWSERQVTSRLKGVVRGFLHRG